MNYWIGPQFGAKPFIYVQIRSMTPNLYACVMVFGDQGRFSLASSRPEDETQPSITHLR